VTMNGNNEEQSAPDSAPIVSLQNGPSSEIQPESLPPNLDLSSRVSFAMSRLSEAYVYVVFSEATGLRKIGMTKDLPGRLRQLQCDSAYPLRIEFSYACFSGTEGIFESILHRVFAHKRTHGEWFKLDENDLLFLEGTSPLNLRMHKLGREGPHKIGGMMEPPEDLYRELPQHGHSPNRPIRPHR
jgi:hypothetical protein